VHRLLRSGVGGVFEVLSRSLISAPWFMHPLELQLRRVAFSASNLHHLCSLSVGTFTLRSRYVNFVQ
jgi:hypothetical protein